MRSSIRSLAIALSTVAALAVTSLALDPRTGAPSGDPLSASGGRSGAIVSEVAGSPGPLLTVPAVRPLPAAVDVASPATAVPATSNSGSGDPAGWGVAPASLEAPAVVLGGSPGAVAPVAVPPATEPPTPWTAPSGGPEAVPHPTVVAAVPVAPAPVVLVPVEAPLQTPPENPVAAPIGSDESGTSTVGSGMGGDLPPEALPLPPYSQCPITDAGVWWTDPADPYTCIPPDPIPFHEPTPPGMPPELLEPIFEDSSTDTPTDAPAGDALGSPVTAPPTL
jgi:hypothetical protein